MSADYLKELGDSIALAHWGKKKSESTYEQICDRVVNYICDDPSDEGRRYNHRMKMLLKNKIFIPNSPCWINAGTDMKNLFACYVVELKDSMDSIMDTAKRMAMIMKEGGGVGVSLTPIRAEGTHVGPEDSDRTASGPISFLKVFDAVVGAVKSAGVRRGAALANLKVGHPDLIKFIKCKEDQHQINNFNLSVAITDEFMEDVIKGSDKVWAKEEVDTGEKDSHGNPIMKLEDRTASDIYSMIIKHMWKNGEPGVQFIDTVNNVDGKYTGRPAFREFNTGIEVSNPCGESFLKPNEACNLGAINLYHFVHPFWEEIPEESDIEQINQALRQELVQTVQDAIKFLNLMIDKSETPFSEINKAVKASRKTGLGVMGLADYLSAKGITYGSPEAVHEAADIFNLITTTAEEYSLRMGFQNACLTIQAPTGTTGLVGEASTGIEPHFLRCWNRESVKMGDMVMYPKSLRDYIKATWENPEVLFESSLEQFQKFLDDPAYPAFKKFWPTAHEIPPKQHLAMLAAIQRHVHNSVSKTINLPEDATVSDVNELIITAWRTGVKGFTCYRDGSRDSQPLTKVPKKGVTVPLSPIKRPRPSVTEGATLKVKIGCGNLYITVNSDDQGICEVFTALGRSGGCPSQSEATSRLISLALRSGISLADIMEQLKGIRCFNTMRQGGCIQSDGTVVLSCPDAIGKAIDKVLHMKGQGIVSSIPRPEMPVVKPAKELKCPECGKELSREGGCIICRHCGFSRCG